MTGSRGAIRFRVAGVAVAVLCIAAAAPGPSLLWPTPSGPASGTRLQADGRGTFPAYQSLRARTGKTINWMIATPLAAGAPARLIAVRADAGLAIFAADRPGLRMLFQFPEAASPDAAPAAPIVNRAGDRAVVATALDGSLTVIWGGQEVRVALSVTLSPLAHLVAVDVDGDGLQEILGLSREGELLLIAGLPDHGRVVARLAVHALPDARIAVADLDGDGRAEAVLLTGPTGRYANGILGDAVEAEAVTVVELGAGTLRERGRFVLSADAVFEDLGPVLADLDGDGRPEILVVRSSLTQGGGVLALAWRGGRLEPFAEGPTFGRPGRWVHLLGVADLEGNGRPHVVVQRAPHIGGTLQSLEVQPPRLVPRVERPGFGSHAINSRNLDQVAMGDLNGDNRPQIIGPDRQRQRLLALEWLGGGLLERWSYGLGGPISSNLVIADLAGGGLLDLAVADAKGNLHVLLSRR